MKKNFWFIAATSVLVSSVLFSSCIGSFSLSNRLLAWNKTVDNKFVNEIIFVVLSPVYGITMFADVMVINSIEFWSGDNPFEAGIIKTVKGENGNYTVETLENGYNIKNENGEEMNFIYNKTENTWSLVENEKSTKLLKIEDGEAIVYLPNGIEQRVELSSAGVLAFNQSIEKSLYMAIK